VANNEPGSLIRGASLPGRKFTLKGVQKKNAQLKKSHLVFAAINSGSAPEGEPPSAAGGGVGSSIALRWGIKKSEKGRQRPTTFNREVAARRKG